MAEQAQKRRSACLTRFISAILGVQCLACLIRGAMVAACQQAEEGGAAMRRKRPVPEAFLLEGIDDAIEGGPQHRPCSGRRT